MKCPYPAIKFRPRMRSSPTHTKRTPKIIGLDTEAYESGQPFMVCLSTGHTLDPKFIISELFRLELYKYTLVVYNLKYDEGALLYYIPIELLQQLRIEGVTNYGEYKIKSIPHKCLEICYHKHAIRIFDIAQFFAQSLDQASQRYLGKSKIEVETKKFNTEYVHANWTKLANYCIRDAELTAELTEYFLRILNEEFDIYPTKLYSVGYIAGLHFCKTCGIQSIERFRQFYPKLLQYAYESYQGGKFETYQRGFGYFYEYDINSAYPSQIALLQAVELAKVVETGQNTYLRDATFGFLHCDILESSDYSPIAIKNKTGLLNYYPIGAKRNKIISKRTYEYLLAHGAEIKIQDAYWLYCPKEYPYKSEVERLFKLKTEFKGKNELKYLITKLLLNSLYGKFIQVTPEFNQETKETDFYAGYLFNPIYASYITEGCRLNVCEVCAANPDVIVAVHTDSIISTEKLPLECSKDLGKWGFEVEGFGVMVGCGVYQIAGKTKYRGFVSGKDSPINLLSEIETNKGNAEFNIEQTMVLSWRNVLFRNELPDLINRFTKTAKELNLNFDHRRNWDSVWNWDKTLVQSQPRIGVF